MQYCGTDIIEVERIKDAIDNINGFKTRVYSKSEIENGEKKKDQNKYEYYAGRFAAKEAIYKALSAKYANLVELTQIEILSDEKNRPIVNFMNLDFKSILEKDRVYVDVSISHIKEYAVANAIIYTAYN